MVMNMQGFHLSIVQTGTRASILDSTITTLTTDVLYNSLFSATAQSQSQNFHNYHTSSTITKLNNAILYYMIKSSHFSTTQTQTQSLDLMVWANPTS